MSARTAPYRPRVRRFFAVSYPGVVTVCLMMLSLTPGALAFDIRNSFALSSAEIGAAVSGFYVASTVVTWLAVPVVRRLGSLNTVRVALGFCALVALLVALVGGKAALLSSCLAAGATNGLGTPAANLLIALTVPVRRQGLAFGLRVSAVPASAALAAAGSYVVTYVGLGWRGFYAAFALVCVLALLASLMAPRPQDSPRTRATTATASSPNSPLVVLALGGLLAATACSTLSPFLVDGLIAGGATPAAATLLLGISAWLGVGTRVATGILADRVPEPTRHLVAASAMLLTCSAGMLLLGFASGTLWLAIGTLLTFSIGWGWPGLLHHAAITIHSEHMAKATTYMQMGTYVGALVGPVGFGLLVEGASFTVAWTATAAAVAASAATIAIVAKKTRTVPQKISVEGRPEQEREKR